MTTVQTLRVSTAEPISKLSTITCHMGQPGVTCQLTACLALTLARQLVLDLPNSKGRKDELTCYI